MIKVAIKKKLTRYNGSSQLQLTASFARGKVTALQGPSGSGKTTFLRIMAGLAFADEGTIIVQDEVWMDTQKKIHLPTQLRQVGFVFQQYALFPNFTVEKHLHYGSHDKGYISRLLQLGDLYPFRFHKPSQLSGGQQQRLALLRALSTKPRLLLMDEPFSALDVHLKEKIMGNLLQLIAEQQITCLVATHSAHDTAGFCTSSIHLD